MRRTSPTEIAATDLSVAAFVSGDVLSTVSGSGRAQSLKELIDLGADARRHAAKILGNRFDRSRARTRSVRGLADAPDLAGGVGRTPRSDLDAARDLLRGGSLLGDRRRDRVGDRTDVADGPLDV